MNYTKEQYLKALLNNIEGTYIIEKDTEYVAIWQPIHSTKFYLKHFKKPKTRSPYLYLQVGDEGAFVSTVFEVETLFGTGLQIDLKVDDVKHYFVVEKDHLENTNILIKRK